MNRLKQFLTPTGYKIGLLITILSIAIYSMDIQFFRLMELKAFDLHFLSRGAIEPENNVIIVAIDEKSLDRFGRWPWPRTRIAELVEKLKNYGAKSVAFDIVFAEPDESSGINVIRGLKDKLKSKGSDVISTIESEEKRLTCLFSDIRGFTTVSESLKPDALVKLINDYLTPMTDIVLKNDGTIDKYMGDTVNLGSRLEGLNKEYETYIIVPKYTYEDVKAEFIFRQIDVVKVKGKDRPIKIYELMGEKNKELNQILGLSYPLYNRRENFHHIIHIIHCILTSKTES